MTWQVTAEDVLSGKGAETVGQKLWTRDSNNVKRTTTYSFPEDAAFTDDTWEDVANSTKRVRVPSFVLTNYTLHIEVWVYGGDVGNEHQARIQETDTTTNGTAVNDIDEGGAWARRELTLTVPNDTWAGTLKNFVIQGYDTSTAAVALKLKGEDLALNMWFESA